MGWYDPADLTQSLVYLVDAYGDEVMHLAYFYLQDRTAAEDTTQEVFVRAYQALPSLREPSLVRNWLLRITTNLCRDYVKRWSNRHLIPMSDEALLSTIDAQAAACSVDGDMAGNRLIAQSPEERALADEGRRDVVAAVLQLPEEMREAIVMYYFEELTTPEIAAILGVPQVTVRSRLYRARQRLAQIMEQENLADGSAYA